MKRILFIATILMFFIYFGASAQEGSTKTRVATGRQVSQKARINQGVRSGELTRKETAGLKAQQRHINRTKRQAKADGVVTRKEKREINRKQNRASRNINRQKNDAQSRG